jgi:hypothetical protein
VELIAASARPKRRTLAKRGARRYRVDRCTQVSLVPATQILFGSDYPYRAGEDHVRGLMEYGFTPPDIRAIERDNAVRLLPRFKSA